LPSQNPSIGLSRFSPLKSKSAAKHRETEPPVRIYSASATLFDEFGDYRRLRIAPLSLSGGSNWYGSLIGSTINDSGGVSIYYDRELGATNPILA
jgi:hypothetical protein